MDEGGDYSFAPCSSRSVTEDARDARRSHDRGWGGCLEGTMRIRPVAAGRLWRAARDDGARTAKNIHRELGFLRGANRCVVWATA